MVWDQGLPHAPAVVCHLPLSWNADSGIGQNLTFSLISYVTLEIQFETENPPEKAMLTRDHFIAHLLGAKTFQGQVL